MTITTPLDRSYHLADRYSRTSGRVFLTGTQALERVMLDQARRDKRAGLNTAGFVSGYRGSPLGSRLRGRGRVFHVVRQGARRGPVGRRAETRQCLWIVPQGRRAGGGGR